MIIQVTEVYLNATSVTIELSEDTKLILVVEERFPTAIHVGKMGT